MRAPALTDVRLQAWVRRPPEKRKEVADGGCPGLYARVGPGGITWSARLRVQGHSQPVRIRIGPYPTVSLAEARERVEEERRKLYGIDAPIGRVPTLEEVAEAWLLHLEAHRSAKYSREARRMIERDLLPELGYTPADRISRRPVRALVRRIAARGAPIVANRVQAYLSAMISWAMDQDDLLLGVVEANPILRMSRESAERPRRRTLSWGELRQLWEALEADGGPGAVAHQVALLTWLRRDSILGARVEEVDAAAGWWDVPPGRLKGRRGDDEGDAPQGVYLVPEAVEILLSAREGEWLFPSRATSGPLVEVKHITRRMRVESGVDGWSMHDLRRTGASRARELGIAEPAIQAALGHRSGTTARRHYIHAHRLPDVQAALTHWQTALLDAVRRDAAPVVDLGARAAPG